MHVPQCLGTVHGGGAGHERGTRVVRAGWVYRMGNTRVPTQPPSDAARGGPHKHPAKRPRKPCRGWSGWGAGSGRTGDGGGHGQDHPAGPVGPASWPSLSFPLRMPPPGHRGRDSTSFTVKLVKTTKCRSNITKRPVIVPIFKNGSRMSPLEIPGFPLLLAFSHKELMGLLDPRADFLVKMTKCRPFVHL